MEHRRFPSPCICASVVGGTDFAKVCKSIFLLKIVEAIAKYEYVCRYEWLDGDLEGEPSFVESLKLLRLQVKSHLLFRVRSTTGEIAC